MIRTMFATKNSPQSGVNFLHLFLIQVVCPDLPNALTIRKTILTFNQQNVVESKGSIWTQQAIPYVVTTARTAAMKPR